MKDEYYIYINGEKRGPFTFRQMQGMWASGVITGQTLYWQDGLEEWEALSALRDQIEPAPAHSPAVAPPPPETRTNDEARGCLLILVAIIGVCFFSWTCSSRPSRPIRKSVPVVTQEATPQSPSASRVGYLDGLAMGKAGNALATNDALRALSIMRYPNNTGDQADYRIGYRNGWMEGSKP